MDTNLAALVVVFLALSGEAFLSVIETALLAMGGKGLTQLQKSQPNLSRPLQPWIDNAGRALASLRMSRKTLAVGGATFAALIGFNIARKNPALALVAIAIPILFLFVEIVFCDICPKIAARNNPERLFSIFVRPALLVSGLFSPLTAIFNGLANLIARLSGGKPVGDSPLVTENLILSLVADGEAQGVIDEDEREMIDSILEFGETTVKEVMVPRIDMTVADQTLTVNQAAQVLQEMGHSRIPVTGESIDQIIGIITSKDLLRAIKSGRGEDNIRNWQREPIFVPESKKLDDLLHEFQQKRAHIAIVVDEYGGTSGLVTMEDLLEEIVGEIRDEFDTEEALVRKLDDRTFRVNAKIGIDELNEIMDISLPDDPEYETLGGFVYNRLERIPRPGETIEHDSLRMHIEHVAARRIKTIKIVKLEPQKTQEEAS